MQVTAPKNIRARVTSRGLEMMDTKTRSLLIVSREDTVHEIKAAFRIEWPETDDIYPPATLFVNVSEHRWCDDATTTAERIMEINPIQVVICNMTKDWRFAKSLGALLPGMLVDFMGAHLTLMNNRRSWPSRRSKLLYVGGTSTPVNVTSAAQIASGCRRNKITPVFMLPVSQTSIAYEIMSKFQKETMWFHICDFWNGSTELHDVTENEIARIRSLRRYSTRRYGFATVGYDLRWPIDIRVQSQHTLHEVTNM